MSFLAKLKSLFRSKKTEPVQNKPVEQSYSFKAEEEKKAEPVKKIKDERQQKMCPHCGVENDQFVNKCWLCKKEM